MELRGWSQGNTVGQRGSVFLLSVVALTVLLLLGTSLMQTAANGLGRASDYNRRSEALSLAEAGVDMALAKLYENYDGAGDTLESTGTYSDSFSLADGSVSYSIAAPYNGIANTCLVDAQATTWANRSARIRTVAYYVIDSSRVFEGAIFCDTPLTLNGSGGVYPDEDGEGGDIYANGNITFNGTSFTMTADASLYSTGTINWIPPDVPATSVHQYVAPLEMPIIDLDYYESLATTIYTGNTTFSNANMENLTGVIFVKGNVTISGNYSGQAMIVATGKIQVTGSVTTEHLDTDTLALISPKSIKIAGNSTIHGLVYSHSVLEDAATTLSGDITVYGAICGDLVRSNGGIEVYYRDVWKNLPLPGEGKTQWAPISWEIFYL